MAEEKYISSEEKIHYFEKLIKPYSNNGTKKFPIDQYLKADGNELIEKFWNKKSSSRLAFDLYLDLTNSKNVKDFEFEYKLPGLKSGGKTPNMDVFIETEEEQIFIESKFTEVADLRYRSILSSSYYSKDGKMSLDERYYNTRVSMFVGPFVDDIEEIVANNRKRGAYEWFYPKQETCHIIGILLHILNVDNKNRTNGKKKFRFYNIYWNLNDEESDIQKKFKERALKFVHDVLNTKDIEFTYKSFSIQDLIKNKESLSHNIKFDTSKTERKLEQYYLLTKDKSRKEMKNF